MKKINLLTIVFIAAGLFSQSCDEILKDLFSIDSKFYTRKFEVVEGTNAGEYLLVSHQETSDLEKKLKENDFSADVLEEVRVKQASLTILNTNDGVDFDDFSSAYVNIHTDGMEKERIAKVSDIPPGSTSVNLEVEDVNLKEYLEKEKITFEVYGVLNDDIEKTIEMELKVKFTYKGQYKELL